MKSLLLSLIVILSVSAFAEVKEPTRAGNGWVNVNSKVEYTQDIYPGVVFWREFGRAYWKDAGQKQMAAKPAKRTRENIVELNVTFELGKTSLREDSLSDLNKFAKMLKNNRRMKAQIQGHTDDRGNHDFNVHLSNKRAKSVMDYLISKHEIAAGRLEAKGYGPDMPISDNKTSTGRRANRRVEAQILKK